MNARMNAAMLEAARLTRAGQLLDATEIIQRILRTGDEPGPTANDAAGGLEAPIEGEFHVIDVAGPGPMPPQPASKPRRPPGRWASSHSGTATPSMDLSALKKPWRLFKGAPPQPILTPDPLPDGAQFVTGSCTNPSGTRSYKLYVPSGHDGQPRPLVVMLHGCTQDPDDFAAGTRMNELAENERCLVLYPAQAQAANVSKCWNWFKATDQERGRGEPSIIADMTRQVCATHSVDPCRIYVAGLSAGGAMAVTMGINYPDLYAAVGIHSGLPHAVACDLPSALAAMQSGGTLGRHAKEVAGMPPFPVIVFHGDRDTTVHPCNGDQVIAQCAGPASAEHFRAGAVPLTTVQQGQVPNGHAYTRTTHYQPDGRSIAEHWLVHGAGHAWSGGSSHGSYTDSKGPDATQEMLRFFLEHPRCGTPT